MPTEPKKQDVTTLRQFLSVLDTARLKNLHAFDSKKRHDIADLLKLPNGSHFLVSPDDLERTINGEKTAESGIGLSQEPLVPAGIVE
jgi:hypothetical protein